MPHSQNPENQPMSAGLATDITLTHSPRVACDGGGGALGHPKTYLDMGTADQVICKYCDRVFKLNA